MQAIRPLVIVGLASLALVGCTAQPESTVAPNTRVSYDDGTIAAVKEVKNGNTVSVTIGDATKEVRLLNVVAPSANNNQDSGTCLLAESTEYLAQKLPAGTEVTLNFDPAQVGSSGYVDAAVYVGEDFINKDIVAAGLASTTYQSQNDKFYPEISAAQQDAAREGLGLYSKGTDCTIAHTIQAEIDAVKAAGSLGENEQKVVYQQASIVYNTYTTDKNKPAEWVGSIVSLEAIENQLDDLKTELGKNYYNEKGLTEADLATASPTSRPGGN